MRQGRLPCPKCGSSDAVTHYGEGKGAYCFSCKKAVNIGTSYEGNRVQDRNYDGLTVDIINSAPNADLSYRAIPQDIAKQANVKQLCNPRTGLVDQVAYPYTNDNGHVVGYKVKAANGDKDRTYVVGKLGNGFGTSQLRNGKFVIVTEGEEDCLAARAMLQQCGKDYNVVSIADGASTGDVSKNTAALMQDLAKRYSTICLAFDMDLAGRAYSNTVAKRYSPIVEIRVLHWDNAKGDCKDANDLLCKGKAAVFMDAINKAKRYQLDVALYSEEVSGCYAPLRDGIQTPSFPSLNSMTKGFRGGEIVTVTALPGGGKTTFMRQIEYDFIMQGKRVGFIHLEESVTKTKQGLLALAGKIPLWSWRQSPPAKGSIPAVDKMEQALVDSKSIFIPEDTKFSLESVMDTFRYLVDVEKCDAIVLDPISYIVNDNGQEGGERQFIDNFMSGLREFKNSNCVIFVVVHMKKRDIVPPRWNKKKPDDEPPPPFFEPIAQSDLRGSAAYAMVSHIIIALSPLITPGCQTGNRVTRLSVIKNREVGIEGTADHITVDPNTGHMVLTIDPT